MKKSLLIGKDSAGKNQFIDLSEVPVLIVSFCDENQLTSIFSQFGVFESSTRHYLITNTRYFNIWKFDKERFRVFMRDEPEFDIISRNDLINQIVDEIIRRQKIMKQKKTTDFRMYNIYSIKHNKWKNIYSTLTHLPDRKSGTDYFKIEEKLLRVISAKRDNCCQCQGLDTIYRRF